MSPVKFDVTYRDSHGEETQHQVTVLAASINAGFRKAVKAALEPSAALGRDLISVSWVSLVA